MSDWPCIPHVEKHPKVRAIPNHDFDTYLAEVAIRMLEPTGAHYNKMDHFKKLKYNSGTKVERGSDKGRIRVGFRFYSEK